MFVEKLNRFFKIKSDHKYIELNEAKFKELKMCCKFMQYWIFALKHLSDFMIYRLGACNENSLKTIVHTFIYNTEKIIYIIYVIEMGIHF